MDFLAKKWGFIREETQKHDFSHYLGLYSRVGLHSCGYGIAIPPDTLGFLMVAFSPNLCGLFISTLE